MAFDIPISILYLYVALCLVLWIVGIVLGGKKKDGAPFIATIAGIMLFSLIPLISGIEVDYADGVAYTLTYPMNVTTGTTGLSFTSTLTGIAERPANYNSLLYDKEISCIIVDMDKEGSPTGTVSIGILDNDNMLVKTFGTIDASTLNANQRGYKFCLANHDYYQIALYDRIGVKFTNGGAGTDTVRLFVDGTNPFDGTNTVRTAYSSGAWSDVSSGDMRIILISDNAIVEGEPIVHEFSQFDTYPFIVFLSAIFIITGVVMQIQDWSKK